MKNWIKLSDKKPDKIGAYLVYGEEIGFKVEIYTYYDGFNNPKITHWQTLTEPENKNNKNKKMKKEKKATLITSILFVILFLAVFELIVFNTAFIFISIFVILGLFFLVLLFILIKDEILETLEDIDKK